MSFKKGLVQVPQSQQNAAKVNNVQITHNVAGRQVQTKRADASRIVQPGQTQQPVQRPVLKESVQPVRGLLVDASGRPLRGLSQSTVAARDEANQTATERCTRCGQMRTRAQMKTIIPNAEQPNNPLVICDECTKTAYKDPRNTQERWKPEVPTIRFDRERGQPYDARRAGVSISDLVNKDTYHNEREVDGTKKAQLAQQSGPWSGAGPVGRTTRSKR